MTNVIDLWAHRIVPEAARAQVHPMLVNRTLVNHHFGQLTCTSLFQNNRNLNVYPIVIKVAVITLSSHFRYRTRVRKKKSKVVQ